MSLWLIAPEKSLAMPSLRRIVKKILVLGGTTEAREIAAQLVAAGHVVTSSLAGVTRNPLLPVGKVRIGGFGGSDGLRAYLQHETIELVVDATHPFAAQMSHNASLAVQNSHVQLLRFERPAWHPMPDEHWTMVNSLADAARDVPTGAKLFVTSGRKGLACFFDRADLSGVMRMVEPPTERVPPGWRILLDRPPHRFAEELALFQAEGFSHVISKNAGGVATRAKLDVARKLGLAVVMVQRPCKPPCESFSDVKALILRLGTSGDNG